jgi:caspase domain-containing protein
VTTCARAAALTTRALPLFLGLALSAGCASIPEPEKVPRRLFPEPQPISLRLALGEIEVNLAVEERTKAQVAVTPKDDERYSVAEVIDYGALRRELSKWIQASESFARVRVAEGDGPRARRIDAWEARDDLLLDIELRDFRTRFDGHNWLWIPNVLNWAYWIVPSWFIATEEYSLELTALARIRQLSGGPVLSEVEVPVLVEGTFGDFERGWQFFGPIYPSNDSENWRNIAQALWPAARAQLSRGIATALREASQGLETRLQKRELSKTLVLTIGISHYQDTVLLPTLPFAAEDARSTGAAVAQAAGLLPQQVFTRHEAQATRAGVEEALAEVRDRARAGDTVVIYFAGYGARDPEGQPRLLLNGPAEQASLSLEELATLLEPIAGAKALILDCGFDDDQGRAVAGAKPADTADEIERIAAASGCGVIAATTPTGSFLTPGHLKQSLFAACLVEGLSGLADRDHDSVVSFSELSDYVRTKTTAESAFLGTRPQRPRAAGGEAFRLKLREKAK